ncbi:MAG: 4'-phosphopantetheinyl transferase superfamily protein [Clostridia bacterium]|nr:4'-phosphopantetheinyl transferase superfamily protein [Clostridia bacterium]
MKIYYTRSAIAGETFVKKILKSEYAIGSPEIFRNENGKPFLNNAPLFFSVSHSGELTAAAIGQDEVGLDLELRRTREYASVVRRMTPAERKEDFFRVWTAKEAYVKFKGSTLAALYRKLEYRGGIIYEDGKPLSVALVHAELHGCELCVCTADPVQIEITEI